VSSTTRFLPASRALCSIARRTADATPRPRQAGSVYIRLISATVSSAASVRQPPQPAGAPSTHATRNEPAGAANSAGSTGVSSPLLLPYRMPRSASAARISSRDAGSSKPVGRTSIMRSRVGGLPEVVPAGDPAVVRLAVDGNPGTLADPAHDQPVRRERHRRREGRRERVVVAAGEDPVV